MQNGFDDSGIRMNTWIAKKNKWTLAELEERSEYLMSRALSIWAAPVTEYKPEEKQLDRSKRLLTTGLIPVMRIFSCFILASSQNR